MKTLENKLTTLPAGEGKFVSYSDLVRVVVDFVNPKEGISADQMRKRIHLLDALQDGVMEFEDEDVKLLKSLVKGHVWRVMSKELVEFSDAVEAL